MNLPQRRGVSDSHFGDNARVNQGDIHYHLPQRPARTAVHAIPYPRNEDVVQRQDLVDKVNELLPPTATEYYSAALYGLGGSGKTQIALDYAYRRCRDHTCSVFWVHADSEATFIHDYEAIARRLEIDTRLKKEDLLDEVRNNIEALEKWLLVLDNADDLSLFGVGQERHNSTSTNLSRQVPRAPSGTVLWTSRDERIAGTLVGPRRGVKVGRMTPREAIELLSIAGNMETGEDIPEATALLDELQRLPLAISQAGAYIRRASASPQDYLALLKKGKRRWQILQETEVDRHRRPLVPNGILETWAISMERIREESEMAHRIIYVIAYMDHRNLTFEILARAGTQVWNDEDEEEDTVEYSDDSGSEGNEELEVKRAITRLKEFSFLTIVETEHSQHSYEMHKLVQEAARYRMSIKKAAEIGVKASVQDGYGQMKGEVYLSKMAVQIMWELFPTSKQETWWQCEQYLAHAVMVGEWAEGCGEQIKAAQLLSRVSDFLFDRGRWREKEPVDKRALQFRQLVLGEKHPDTISSMADLATTYHAQGHYAKAEPIYVEVLDLGREVLGQKHPNTIRGMASLAATYHNQGHYAKAELMYVEVLDLRREVLGEKHPDTIRGMADLATTYHAQGRYAEDEEISVKVLDLRREVLGEKHPDTIRGMADLATTYHAQGHYAKAELIYVEVLDLRREVLGEKHPDTISSMADLATTYHAQGHYAKAELIKVKVLDLGREVLGQKHPDTISSMADLATTYHAQGHYAKAELIKVKVLDLGREVLGEKHPDTISSMADLATTYHAQGHYAKAELIYVEVLDLRREVLGQKHPNTIRGMASLATTYHNQGHYAKAELIKVKVLDLGREVLGEKHPDTIRGMAELATTYHAQSHYAKAELIYVEVLDLRREVLGEKHPDTISSMADLATTYHAQGHYAKAELIELKVLDLRREVLGEKHPDTLQAIHDLAISWHKCDRHDEALSLMRQCLQWQQSTLGLQHPSTIRSAQALKVWEAKRG